MGLKTLTITRGRGFHADLTNGIKISVQMGAGNYADNYDEPIRLRDGGYILPPSTCAEIAIWNREDHWFVLSPPDQEYQSEVAGYVKIDLVFDIIAALRAIPDDCKITDVEAALLPFRSKL